MKTDRAITMAEFTGLPVGPDLSKMRLAVQNLRAMSALMIECSQIQAKITRAKYDALVAEEFTPDQAIELCKGQQ